jgi:purine nucleoside permease
MIGPVRRRHLRTPCRLFTGFRQLGSRSVSGVDPTHNVTAAEGVAQSVRIDAAHPHKLVDRLRAPLVAVLTLTLVVVCMACGAGSSGRFAVRVLVITMFELETAPWLAHESLPITIAVPALRTSLRCASTGLCVATIGQGKANAAANMSAILDNPALDFHHAYFLTSGIAGVSPQTGTLGFVAWARWVVDWDLGHHLNPDAAPDVPFGYLPYEDQHTNVFRLNETLVDKAYELTNNLPLSDSPEAAATRTHFPGQAGRKPFTAICDTITGDDYWTGAQQSQEAQYITSIWTKNQGTYCTTQMEDNATATAVDRHGYLSRYLSLRTASDFDQPYLGQTTKDALTSYPATQPAINNAYLAGSTVVHYLLNHPPQ